MPTIVGILIFISRINTTSEVSKTRKIYIFQHFSIYEELKFNAQLSCVEYEKSLITSGPEVVYFHIGWIIISVVDFLNTGHNPMDLAQSWADPRVLSCVQSKWETLPPVGQGKGKGGKGGKKGGDKPKRPQSVPPGDGSANPPGTAKVS